MSTADKLVMIAENVEKVYNAGFEKGKVEGGGGGLPNSKKWVDSVYNVRLDDLSWASEVLELEFPSVTNLTDCLSDAKFNTETNHIIVRCIKPVTNASEFCRRNSSNQNRTITRLTLYADFSQCTSFNYFISMLRTVKIIDGDAISCWSGTNLVNMFYLCDALEEVRFVQKTIKKSCVFSSAFLSEASVQSIIEGLFDLTGGTAQTLTLNADVKANLTETQLATITGKNWTVA